MFTGEIRDRWWITAINKDSLCDCGCGGRCSFDDVWAVVSWSMTALMLGKWPEQNHLGQEFDDPWRRPMRGKPLPIRAACLAKTGDWAWMKQAMDLNGWNPQGLAKRMCWICEGGKRLECSVWDFSMTTPWRQTIVSQRRYWENVVASSSYVSGLFAVPGFCVDFCKPDFMHRSCLDVVQNVSGNCVYEMMLELAGASVGPRSKRSLSRISRMVTIACKELNVDRPIKRFTRGMAIQAGKPNLNSKAAEGRKLLPVLVFILERFFPLETEHSVKRLQCLRWLAAVYEELSD